MRPVSPEDQRWHAIYWAIGYFVASIVVALTVTYLGHLWAKPILTATGITILLAAVFLFLSAMLVAPDPKHPSELLLQFLRDEDGVPSLSRFQLFLWGVLVLVAFVWFTLIRIYSGVPAFSGSFPPNLLGILTISTGSTVWSNQLNTAGPNLSEDVKKYMNGWGAILNMATKDGRNHVPSFGRFQMLGWTVISVGIYTVMIYVAIHQVWVSGSAGSLALPDLDPTLVVLMGLSHAGYIGSKAIGADPSTP